MTTDEFPIQTLVWSLWCTGYEEKTRSKGERGGKGASVRSQGGIYY